jgi:transcriptional regulator with XRE-family HTH domain
MDPILTNLARNTKKFRLNKGWTQEMLAVRAGVTRGFISLLESGKKKPAVSTLSKIADALGIGVGDFFADQSTGLRFVHIKKSELCTPLKKDASAAYVYKPLASAMKNKMADPFFLRVDAKKDEEKQEFVHKGEEFNLILQGKVKFIYGGKEYILEEGDANYLDSSVAHSVLAFDNKPAYLLNITINQ